MIERNQIAQIEAEALQHPIVRNHDDSKGLLREFIKTPWYYKTNVKRYAPDYEWYWTTPFWIIALFHKEEFDITNMKRPDYDTLERILRDAYKIVLKEIMMSY